MNLGEIGSCFSRLLNALLGGRSDWTTSARAHRDNHIPKWSKAEKVIDFLFILSGPNHCEFWYYDEIARSEENLKTHKDKYGP